jgi:hypothetical protein
VAFGRSVVRFIDVGGSLARRAGVFRSLETIRKMFPLGTHLQGCLARKLLVAVARVLEKVVLAVGARCNSVRWARKQIQPHRRPADPCLRVNSDFGHDDSAVEIGLKRRLCVCVSTKHGLKMHFVVVDCGVRNSEGGDPRFSHFIALCHDRVDSHRFVVKRNLDVVIT